MTETQQTQTNIIGQFFMPFAAAIKQPEETEAAKTTGKSYTNALAICEGTFNDTYFPPAELTAMVDRHNASKTVSKIRVCEEHRDNVGCLLGRLTAMRTRDDASLGKCVDVDFELFDKTPEQQNVISQLEQAPDLIGLSICISGDLAFETCEGQGEDGKPISYNRLAWANLQMYHIAICTWPACDATTGTIKAASYKHADGTEFNPSFFTSAPTNAVMTETHQGDTPAAPDVHADFKAVQRFAVEAGKFAAQMGVELNSDLLASFDDTQRSLYLTDLSKLAAAVVTAKQTPAPTEGPKGSEFAGEPKDATATLANDFLNNTGAFAYLGKMKEAE